MRIDDAVLQEIAVLIEGCHLAAGAEAGINGQNAFASQWRLQEQAAQIASKHRDGVGFGLVGQLAANFPIQAWQHQPAQRVVKDRAQENRMRRFEFPAGERLAVERDGQGFRVQ